MGIYVRRKHLVFCVGLLCLAFVPSSAVAAEFPYLFEPQLSLTGDCTTKAPDLISDPSCPYSAPPGGPSGRFDEPRSIAFDSHGNEYVASFAGEKAGKGRVDIFDDQGRFISELGNLDAPKSVAVDSKGNLYVYANGTVDRYAPTVYEPEAGKIAYTTGGVTIATNPFFGGLAIDVSNDHLYVAEGSAITEYGSAIEGNAVLSTVTNEKLGSQSTWVAVDATRRRLYASYCQDEIFDCGTLVFEADAPHALLKAVDGSETPAGRFLSLKGWLSLAVDEDSGHFFVDDLEKTQNVYEFGSDYKYVSKLNFEFKGGNALQIAVSNGENDLGQDAFNRHFLFVPYLSQSGTALAFEPPGVTAPEVAKAAAAGIGGTDAELQATVDPHGGDTEYVFEYVSQQGFEEARFTNAQIGAKGSIPSASVAIQVSAPVSGLSPGTAYRFRVVAKNEVGEDEEEAVFSTYSDAPAGAGCPNQSLRTGLAASLPDCRAYELVSPTDTGGLPPKGIGYTGDRFATVEAAPLGNAVSFILKGGTLPGAEGTGGFNGDQYRAVRGPSGWVTTGLGPSGTEAIAAHPGSTSADQGFGFWDAVLEGSAVIDGLVTRYLRYPDGHSELVGRGSLATDPRAEGKFLTEGGTHIVFQTRNIFPIVAQQIEPDAPPTGTWAVYDRTPDGVTHVVSLLPGNVTPKATENAVYLGSSTDGEGVAFEIGDKLYLRVHNATTYEIGENVDDAGEHLAFAGVSEGGRRIFYLEDGDLLAFDTETEAVIPFSQSGNVTVVNVASGGSRAYFLSPSVLTAEPNPNGATAQAGKQNLYLSEEGSIGFVGTVTARDVEGETTEVGLKVDGLGLWTQVLVGGQLVWDPSRLGADGSVLLFQSRANLDGYDPGGPAEIYRYDSTADQLQCISCIPTGEPATGGALLQSFAQEDIAPEPFSSFGFVANLRADGRRAFFESTEALVSTDTDEVRDVYEWEEQGEGSCASPGGCVYLITSGHSARDNYLYGLSRSGDDVFFTTADRLTGAGAGGATSIYDARVNGGFAESVSSVCQGEGCRPGLAPPPALTAPAKPALDGEDNFSACPKGKVRRDGRCVKKKPKKHRKHKAGAKQRGAGK